MKERGGEGKAKEVKERRECRKRGSEGGKRKVVEVDMMDSPVVGLPEPPSRDNKGVWQVEKGVAVWVLRYQGIDLRG